MKKELSKSESKKIDLSLKKYLDLYQEENVFKNTLPFFLKEEGIKEDRIEFIITELSTLNILSYKNERGDKKLGHKFNRNEIIELLKNGGMYEKWLEKESKRVNIKLINKTLKDYFWTKCISWASLVIALILAIVEIIQWKNK